MKPLLISLLFLFAGLMWNCNNRGCTDSKAINYEVGSKKDDGSCTYSNVYFFTEDSMYTNSSSLLANWDYIEVSIDGNYFNLIPFTQVHINCTGPEHILEDGDVHTWVATVHFFDATTVQTQGTIQSSHDDQCINVDVLQ